MVPNKLSLISAIGINLNVILGAGIFVNTVFLAQTMGAWGGLTYLLVGTLILPFIYTLSRLVEIHKGGSFYDYAHAIGSWAGFTSQWSYFVGKMASSALGIHVFVSLMQTIFPVLANYSSVTLDYGVIAACIVLNMLNVRLGTFIQMNFFIFKMVPILCGVIGALALIFGTTAMHSSFSYPALFSTVPLALYTFTGFETTCSIIHHIQNPSVNGPRAIIWSYGLSVLIAVIFQTMLFLAIGSDLISASNYLETFPRLFTSLIPHNPALIRALVTLAHVGIACSCLGAAYGVLFSNAWNLHTLATKKLILFHEIFVQKNRYSIPYLCIIAAGSIASCYIWFTNGTLLSLQQINTTALTLTFSLSVAGLIAYYLKNNNHLPLTIYAAIVSCVLLITFLIRNFMTYGAYPLLLYIGLLAMGYGLAYLQQHKSD